MASIDRSYNEKRDFIRMKINSPVSINCGDDSILGVCKDLSGAGMLVETEKTLPVGAELEVSIEQKGETHLPFHATATVSRVEPVDDKFLVGLSIIQIHE